MKHGTSRAELVGADSNRVLLVEAKEVLSWPLGTLLRKVPLVIPDTLSQRVIVQSLSNSSSVNSSNVSGHILDTSARTGFRIRS